MAIVERVIPHEILATGRRDRWDRLVQEQHGIVHLAQLRALGVSWATVRAHVDAGRWVQVVHGVYSTFTGPLPRAARIVTALLYGGPSAVLSHRTAAEEWRMLPHGEGPVHITVPYGTSAITQHGLIVVHRSRAFRHIVVATDPPRTGRADTALDVAVEEPDHRRARFVLTSLLTSGRVRPLDVERRIEERPPRRYRRALRAAVRLVLDGVQSVLEELYAVEVEQAHGLPSAQRQSPHVVDGITFWEDAVYDHLGIALTVRLDGRTHLMDDVAFRDRRRDNSAELAGRSRLVFGWRDLSSDPCGAAAEVFQVLRRLGWDQPMVPCARCPRS